LNLLGQSVVKNSHCDILDMGNMQNLAFCIMEFPYRLFFYREDARFVEPLTIVDDRNNKSYTYEWKKGDNRFLWPVEQFPIQEGIHYRIKTQAGNLWKPISFRKESVANSDENYWVLDWGCLHKVEGVKAEIGPIKSYPFD